MGRFRSLSCVAVWALKLPVPHTDALKTHVSQSFSTDLLEFQKTSNDYLMRPNPPAKLRKKCCPTTGKKEVHLSRDKLNFFFNFGISYGSPFVQNCCISVCTQLPVPPFSLVWFVSWVLLWHTQTGETDFFWPEHWRTLSNIPYIDNSFHRFL